MALRFHLYYRITFAICFVMVIGYAFTGCGHDYAALPDKVDFNYDVRPILVQKCFLCHGPDPGSRKGNLRLDTYEGATALSKDGGKAIDPGHSAKSLVLYRINHKDPDIMMPTPESNLKLTEREIAIIQKWIDQGAEWKQHWSFIPPVEDKKVASVKENPIDYFINKKLKTENIDAAPAAEKNELIRRVAFVLTGLPPSQNDIEAFVNDNTADAYPKMVDRYLNAPQFGERWARHWMDLVRYAETKGHEFDYHITGAWRYRDYLIRAFNNDVPYNQLVEEQLAGDLLPNPRFSKDGKINESVLGTVFNTMAEGSHSPVDIRKDEADRIDNMIDVTSKAFQALTISCARCHDHKFDPIATKDYYSMYGVMEGTRFTPIPANLVQTTNAAKQLHALHDTIKQHVAAYLLNRDTLSNPNKASYASAVISDPVKSEGIILGDFSGTDFNGWRTDGWAFTGNTTSGDPIFAANGTLNGISEGMASSRRISTGIFGALRSPDFTIDKKFIGVRARGKKASVRIIIDNFQLISYPIYEGIDHKIDKNEFTNFTFDIGLWKGHKAYVEILPGSYETHIFKMPKTAWVEVKYVTAFDKSWFEPAPLKQQHTAAINGMENIDLRFLNAQIRFGKKSYTSKDWLRYNQLKNEILNGLPDSAQFINGVTEGFGKNSPIFVRGSHTELSPTIATRSFLPAIKVANSNLNVPGSGRLQLAKAITDPANPLTTRVIVNRIWHHLFGKGIVETVDNFGLQGKLPSHPELLDYMAIQFRRDNYSIKKTIRNILLSETFRRSSKSVGKSAQHDPANIYLSHYPVRRLEAEAIRDAMLAVSGRLDSTRYGTPVPTHITSFMNGRGKPGISGPVDGNGRRSIYIEVRRNFLDPMMTTFDRPIPFTAFGKRTITNVPSQSLILMNDPFVMQQAEVAAKKLLEQNQASIPDRVRWIYQRCFARNPTAMEIADAELFMTQLKQLYVSKGISDNLELYVWKDYIHTVFNMKEFIYLN